MGEIKNAFRALRAAGGSTALALILVTVGLGAGTAVFSIAHAVLQRLPFPQGDRLAVVSGRNLVNGVLLRATPQDFLDWDAQQDVFEALAAASTGPDLVINDSDGPQQVSRTRVTSDLFAVLGVQPALGHAFHAVHEVEGNHLVVVLSDGFWKRRFGGDRGVIGKRIAFESGTYEVLGVMPAGFTFPLGTTRPAEVYTPYVVPSGQKVRGTGRSFTLETVGRLKPGLTIGDARTRMTQLHERLAIQFPEWFENRGLEVTQLREHLAGSARPWMRLLLGAVAFLLLLVCVNVSGFALSRGLARGREIAIRAALGASRWQIARGLVLENVLLCGAGAAGAAALAYAGVALLRTALPATLPRVADVGVDSRVLAAAGLAALVTAVVCSLLPALMFSRADVSRTLAQARQPSDAGSAAGSVGRYLVIAEVALSVILLVGAGLFTASFNRLMSVDLGLDYRNVLTVPAHVRFANVAEREKAIDRARLMLPEVLERVKAIPGVDVAAAIGGGVPLSGGSIRSSLLVRGRATQLDDEVADIHYVSPDYFRALGIPLLDGRLTSTGDTMDAPGVVVLSQAAAKKYFPNGDALRSVVGLEQERDLTVIGIVGNLRLDGPERPERSEAYIPLAQGRLSGADLVVRTTGDPGPIEAAVRAAIWSVEPSALIPDGQTLAARLQRIIAPRKFNMLLFTMLGIVAIAIAATGIYGLLAQQVEQRLTEIGIRAALGARPRDILALVMKRALIYLASGLAAGIVGAWYLAEFVEAFLFQMTPHEVTAYVTAALLLLIVGIAAALVPAIRAMSVDPLITLKTV